MVKDQRWRDALIPKPDAEEVELDSGQPTQSIFLGTSSPEYLKDRRGYCYDIYLLVLASFHFISSHC